MAADRKLGAGEAEQSSEEDDHERIAGGKKGEAEARAIGLGERTDLEVEQGKGERDDGEREEAAADALQQPEVLEGPPDERVGGADQLRHLDLVALREDLQPHGVE